MNIKRVVTASLSSIILIICFLYTNSNPSIVLKSKVYTYEKGQVYATINFEDIREGYCESSIEKVEITGKSCKIAVDNRRSKIDIRSKNSDKLVAIYPDLNAIESISLRYSDVYLKPGDEYTIEMEIEKIGEPEINITYKSDSSILDLEEGTITANAPGDGIVTVMVNDTELTVGVHISDIMKKPAFWETKEYLPCGAFTQKEAEWLDNYLRFKVDQAGYGTRAGAVAAARILVLEFPYKINYFLENGRLDVSSGGNGIDGEGRYYHQGFYLSEDKYATISRHSASGPNIWGCRMYTRDPHDFEVVIVTENGLDCSGFVSWALKNGGLDIGDIGAGDTYGYYDYYKVGTRHSITPDYIYNKEYQVGDLAFVDGHIGLITGIDDTYTYVCESLSIYGGVSIKRYTDDQLVSRYYFTDFIDMSEEYYNGEGNLTQMW
jgi:hypothetical protein